MPRLPRVVVPGIAHHITQRGARRMTAFFRPADFELYKLLMRERAAAVGVDIRAYCLMPNHVHLIVVPHDSNALCRLFRSIHAQYSEIVNARHGWSGHLWQQRFASFPMDDRHVAVALDYVHDNPVRAGLVSDPADWPWSSARAAARGVPDDLLGCAGCSTLTSCATKPASPRSAFEILRSRARTGRPLGSEEFVLRLEQQLGRVLAPQRRGPKPKPPAAS